LSKFFFSIENYKYQKDNSFEKPLEFICLIIWYEI
jgi:hypothetical protein